MWSQWSLHLPGLWSIRTQLARLSTPNQSRRTSPLHAKEQRRPSSRKLAKCSQLARCKSSRDHLLTERPLEETSTTGSRTKSEVKLKRLLSSSGSRRACLAGALTTATLRRQLTKNWTDSVRLIVCPGPRLTNRLDPEPIRADSLPNQSPKVALIAATSAETAASWKLEAKTLLSRQESQHIWPLEEWVAQSQRCLLDLWLLRILLLSSSRGKTWVQSSLQTLWHQNRRSPAARTTGRNRLVQVKCNWL